MDIEKLDKLEQFLKEKWALIVVLTVVLTMVLVPTVWWFASTIYSNEINVLKRENESLEKKLKDSPNNESPELKAKRSPEPPLKDSSKTPMIENEAQPPTSPQVTSSTDKRDEAAKLFGYENLDALMEGFGIPCRVKPRVFVCPREESYCLSVREEQGQKDFFFRNATKCSQDGKQANGTSGIPVGFAGMVRGFAIRPC